VVVVNPDKVAARTLAEFIAYAKADPGKLNYGSAGAGTTHHLAGELFKILTKTNIQHVPYRGAGPAMQDLIAGHVPVVFDGLGSSAAPVRAGQLRACGGRAKTRAGLPRSSDCRGGRPCRIRSVDLVRPVRTQEHKELQKAMHTPAIKEAWERNGSDVPDVTGPAFAKMVSAEAERWSKVVTEANVKLD
jgi:tripartite-type tricarboxylate transporter receptor subunit TctC